MIGDTICAVASPPGASARGVLRISGPAALVAAGRWLGETLERRRGVLEREVRYASFQLEALVLVMPGPHSYTGEDVVELHLPGSPLLLARVGEALAPDARAALPGEFTRRAFENGRIDLSQAEAVQTLIAASSANELRQAMAILDGGLGATVAELRELLLDARAVVEAGLDFEDGDTGAVEHAHWAEPIATACARLDALIAALPSTRPGGDLILLGLANAGKSSLANALSGTDAVLVSPRAGTTRDVLAVAIGHGRRVLDAPGDLGATATDLDVTAIALRDRLARAAHGAILVVDPNVAQDLPDPCGLPVAAIVTTRADLRTDDSWVRAAAGAVPCFAIGCPSGEGVAELRAFLAFGPAGPEAGGARVSALLHRAREALGRAASAGGIGAYELVAVELAEGAEQLRSIDGRGVADGVLDRIFARFCLGK